MSAHPLAILQSLVLVSTANGAPVLVSVDTNDVQEKLAQRK